jgi:ABC-2 type transport system permease protein
MSRPAPAARAVAAVAAMELRLTLRRGENLLVTAVIPAAMLLFLATTGILDVPGRPVDFLLPGAIALAVIATSLVSLGISTAYERHYGVLKRLGGSPLPRWGLFVAKGAAVALVEAVQAVLLLAVAWLLLGWRPGPGLSVPLAIVAATLGTATFAGLGLAMAGRLRAEATLAAANGLFVLFLLLGGIVVPLDHLPEPAAAVAALLPAAPLAEALRISFGAGSDPVPVFATLAAWAIVSVVIAVRTFTWE